MYNAIPKQRDKRKYFIYMSLSKDMGKIWKGAN